MSAGSAFSLRCLPGKGEQKGAFVFVPLELTPSTVVVLLLIVVAMVWAVRRITRRGLCDCKDHCGSKACSKCGAADRMVKEMEEAAKSSK